MLIRIVRMTFQPDHIGTFQKLFSQSQPLIQEFKGCKGVELWQDADNSQIFMTYSIWENAEALSHYRDSELFKRTWAKVKPFFADKPQAFSGLPKIESEFLPKR